MLVLLTPRIESGVTPGTARSCRIQALIYSQLVRVSNTWEPGYAGWGKCDHSRWAIATCLPDGSKSSTRQLPVPASMANKYCSLILNSLSCRDSRRAAWAGQANSDRSGRRGFGPRAMLLRAWHHLYAV